MTRKEAREQAFCLVFEKSFWPETTMEEIIIAAEEAREIRPDEFSKTVSCGVYHTLDKLDNLIEQFSLHWKVTRISKVTLAILRVAIYEMIYMQNIPINVSINEALEIAKKYATPDDVPFINGILGAVAKEIEKEEGK